MGRRARRRLRHGGRRRLHPPRSDDGSPQSSLCSSVLLFRSVGFVKNVVAGAGCPTAVIDYAEGFFGVDKIFAVLAAIMNRPAFFFVRIFRICGMRDVKVKWMCARCELFVSPRENVWKAKLGCTRKTATPRGAAKVPP